MSLVFTDYSVSTLSDLFTSYENENDRNERMLIKSAIDRKMQLLMKRIIDREMMKLDEKRKNLMNVINDMIQNNLRSFDFHLIRGEERDLVDEKYIFNLLVINKSVKNIYYDSYCDLKKLFSMFKNRYFNNIMLPIGKNTVTFNNIRVKNLKLSFTRNDSAIDKIRGNLKVDNLSISHSMIGNFKYGELCNMVNCSVLELDVNTVEKFNIFPDSLEELKLVRCGNVNMTNINDSNIKKLKVKCCKLVRLPDKLENIGELTFVDNRDIVCPQLSDETKSFIYKPIKENIDQLITILESVGELLKKSLTTFKFYITDKYVDDIERIIDLLLTFDFTSLKSLTISLLIENDLLDENILTRMNGIHFSSCIENLSMPDVLIKESLLLDMLKLKSLEYFEIKIDALNSEIVKHIINNKTLKHLILHKNIGEDVTNNESFKEEEEFVNKIIRKNDTLTTFQYFAFNDENETDYEFITAESLSNNLTLTSTGNGEKGEKGIHIHAESDNMLIAKQIGLNKDYRTLFEHLGGNYDNELINEDEFKGIDFFRDLGSGSGFPLEIVTEIMRQKILELKKDFTEENMRKKEEDEGLFDDNMNLYIEKYAKLE